MLLPRKFEWGKRNRKKKYKLNKLKTIKNKFKINKLILYIYSNLFKNSILIYMISVLSLKNYNFDFNFQLKLKTPTPTYENSSWK